MSVVSFLDGIFISECTNIRSPNEGLQSRSYTRPRGDDLREKWGLQSRSYTGPRGDDWYFGSA